MKRTIISLVAAVVSLVPTGLLADAPPADAATGPSSGPAAVATAADLQPNAPDQYTVVKGDTLWGIAGRFLKDPWRWPQIWQMNRDEIKNPHWIYPGDVIHLDRSGANPRLTLERGNLGAEAAANNVVRLEPHARVEPLRAAITSIPGTAIGPFLTQPLVLEAGELDRAPAIVATEESRVVVGQGDTAYADRIGTSDPANWQVFRAGGALRDPDTGEILGYEAHYVGDARVTRYGNPTTLRITKARQEINRGDHLMPARETTLMAYVPHAPDKLIRGSIMSVEGGVSEFGQFQIITINRGARDGIQVGHVLAAYRRGETLAANGHYTGSSHGSYFSSPRWMESADITPVPVVPHPPNVDASNEKAGASLEGRPIRLPDEREGLIFVFRVFEKMSYAMVMQATKPLYVGDLVQTP